MENDFHIGSLLPSTGIVLGGGLWEKQENLFMLLGGNFSVVNWRVVPNNNKSSWLMFYWGQGLPARWLVPDFQGNLAQIDFPHNRFCIFWWTRFLSLFPNIPSSRRLLYHMSDPHRGLHLDHWPPASLLSMPSAPRLGLFGQRPSVHWLDTCLSMLSVESPHSPERIYSIIAIMSSHMMSAGANDLKQKWFCVCVQAQSQRKKKICIALAEKSCTYVSDEMLENNWRDKS